LAAASPVVNTHKTTTETNMIISHQHQFIFVKTRKTAGSTLEYLLHTRLGEQDICTGSETDGTPRTNTENTQGHTPWQEIAEQYPREWQNYYKFTIERNPWEKTASAYQWHRVKNSKRYGDMSFEDYMSKAVKVLPRDWELYSDTKGPVVDCVYQYSQMSEMYQDLNSRFGLDIQESEWHNTKLKCLDGEITNHKQLHSMGTRLAVQPLFEREIEQFGYEY